LTEEEDNTFWLSTTCMTLSDRPSKKLILAALARLNELLHEKGVMGELRIFGGAMVILAFDARESTRGVSGISIPKHEVLIPAKQVAEEFGFEPDWLNHRVKGFISDEAEIPADGMPIYSNLRIARPTIEYLLAMQCRASRAAGFGYEGDRSDIITLIKHTGITDSFAVFDLVGDYYKESLLPPQVRFHIEELVAKVNAEVHL
jgi:hypothetical protein